MFTHSNIQSNVNDFIYLFKDDVEKRGVALQMMPHGIATLNGNISLEIVQKNTSKNYLDIRNELFSTEPGKY